MKDLSVPIPNFGEEEFAEIELKVGDKHIRYNYRVVSFPWENESDENDFSDDISRSLARIERLRNSIKNYDKDWELIQIFNPSESARSIQVLYRLKQNPGN